MNYHLEQIPVDCELLILIGGNSWQIKNNVLKQLIQDRLTDNRFVGAICGAVDYLAKNGLLTDFKQANYKFNPNKPGNFQWFWCKVLVASVIG